MGAPTFNPRLLDACAAGHIDGPSANPICISAAQFQATAGNARLDRTNTSAPGPWTTCDFSRLVRYTQPHYPGPELSRLKHQTRADGRPDISRLGALLAHILAPINRARGRGDSTDGVFLDFTLGARSRVSSPLSNSFIGSPLFLTHI
ncbi:transferase family protein [Aspergillus chevalieri]|uniref:Uncharacterized protein n=1 Tax=Aspergillus chevalieri TaxID=182096 RepID=A0A7R7VTK4_ASPCH|nr:uncharacterized protein ACHE_60425A [Aspergillus chevalieri]BCR90539.1 hypothetical protein ACHE_60425A [Aspergillus chevalieri]